MHPSYIDDTGLFNRAVSAYARWCQRNNAIYQQPCHGGEICAVKGGGRKIVLSNINGVLATYRFDGRRLRMI